MDDADNDGVENLRFAIIALKQMQWRKESLRTCHAKLNIDFALVELVLRVS